MEIRDINKMSKEEKPKTNPNGANQYLIDPRQKKCWDLYVNPKSETFGNALQSALKAGYTEGGNSLNMSEVGMPQDVDGTTAIGRFPANIIHDNSEEVRECFPETGKGNGKGAYNYAGREYNNKETSMFNGDKPQAPSNFNDSGNASRFFKSIIYQAKTSKAERNRGCEELPIKSAGGLQGRADGSLGGEPVTAHNNHPTVKPIALMEYLIKMVTPKGGIVLDPFAGSGSTLVAAKQNGFQYIGIELTEEYIPIIEARLNALNQDKLL